MVYAINKVSLNKRSVRFSLKAAADGIDMKTVASFCFAVISVCLFSCDFLPTFFCYPT